MYHVSPLLIHGSLIALCNPFLSCTDLRPEPATRFASFLGLVLSSATISTSSLVGKVFSLLLFLLDVLDILMIAQLTSMQCISPV
jgi:hypothetical protein